MDRLQIERTGGLGGFGGPHLKSSGEVALSNLPAAQRAAIESLFSRSDLAAPHGAGDVPVYHITRQTPSGTQTIHVPENLAPDIVRNSVKDRLE